MNSVSRYIIGGVAVAVVVFLCWYFSSIIAYVAVAVVISFLGRPLIDRLRRVKIRGRRLGDGLCAAVTLVCVWLVAIFFFCTVIPLVIHEFRSLSDISVAGVVNSLDEPLRELEKGLKYFGIMEDDQNVKDFVVENLSAVLDFSGVKNVFGSVAGTVSGIFIALFSVSFMAFFFLKDSKLFYRMMIAITPSGYEEGVANALDSIQRLLMRYFIGITLEVIIVMTLNVVGLSIVGVAFVHAVVIGLITGITNVIPYLGPILGAVFGLLVGLVTHIDMDFDTVLLPMLIYMTIVFCVTQLIDNIVLQPLIYGNSVYAHPLEIFLVLLVAGNLAGIPGMILAIPGYTVLRVILREFFNKYKLVKSLTRGLDVSDSEGK